MSLNLKLQNETEDCNKKVFKILQIRFNLKKNWHLKVVKLHLKTFSFKR